ncbi:PilZ domain-containing protein [Nitrospirota bacterium]
MRFTRKKILLIDVKGELPALLERMGFEVVSVNDANEAAMHLEHICPDMLVVNTETPRKEIELLQKLDTPSIIMIGDPGSESAKQFIDTNCFLEKPLKLNALVDTLNSVLFAPAGIMRKHLRVAYHGEVSIGHSAVVEELSSTTLSEGGMFIRRKEPLPVGSEASISITFPGGDELSLDGMVIYISLGHYEGSPPGMAMEFYGMSENLKDELREQIKKLIYG